MNTDRFLRALAFFISQWLSHGDRKITDAYVYESLSSEKERLFQLFCLRFDPNQVNAIAYTALYDNWKPDQYIIQFAKICVQAMVKTTFFVTASPMAFRFDSSFFSSLPEKLRVSAFHQVPYAIFFIIHDGYVGLHIRFQDIARGGLRSVFHEKRRASILLECYELAWTQEKKNKDIAEGGSKGVLFVDVPKECDEAVRNELLYKAQKGYIRALLLLVTVAKDGYLKDRSIIDYYRQPEFLYLGPDENMHDSMIEWIAQYSESVGYAVHGAFISGRAEMGINHKRYGVTSHGVTVYVRAVLEYLGLTGKPFSVKMMGGPDGDVAGNQMVNLYRLFPKTAKLVGVTDISGTCVDPDGLDLAALTVLFYSSKPIGAYPIALLSKKGFLLQKNGPDEFRYIRKNKTKNISEEEAEEISNCAVFQIPADIFIPAGGRPYALNEHTVNCFLSADGQPTAKAIVEGANVFITQKIRDLLEEKGVIIIRDSSANKGGVIASSYEVLSAIILEEYELSCLKEQIAREILQKIEQFAASEASLILDIHQRTHKSCSLISKEISDDILHLCDHILYLLQDIKLPHDIEDPLYQPLLAYCLPLITGAYRDRILEKIPENHRKAYIATSLASHFVYTQYAQLQRIHTLPLFELIQQFNQ